MRSVQESCSNQADPKKCIVYQFISHAIAEHKCSMTNVYNTKQDILCTRKYQVHWKVLALVPQYTAYLLVTFYKKKLIGMGAVNGNLVN